MFHNPRTYVAGLVIMLCVILVTIAGCSSAASPSGYAPNPVEQRETLTQISTMNALNAGLYDGIMPCGELKKYGDFGAGSFAAMDGELVELDGKIYQVKSDGVAYPADDNQKTPSASVTFFDSDHEEKLDPGINLADLEKTLDKIIPSANIFCAIKVKGTFSYLQTRSLNKQVKPYPPMTEVYKNQAVFEFHDVAGTIVGFRYPPYTNGVYKPGYNLHFLTDDHKAGGHILELSTKNAVATLDYNTNYLMILPDQQSDFYKIDLSGD